MRASEKAPGAIFPADRPLYYYITDRHQTPDGSIRELLHSIKRAVAARVDLIQIREKDLTDRQLLKLTESAVAMARGSGCRILVNGRFDIAVAGGAHGVHLPSSGWRAADLRPHLPRNFILGVSSHSLAEARSAETGGADFIVLGPVFYTPSKRRYGAPLGLARFEKICSSVRIPVFGLGGIQPRSVATVVAAGACGVAGIRMFQKGMSLPRR